jgi:phosphoribosylformylglycinamidine cyclo-ligase
MPKGKKRSTKTTYADAGVDISAMDAAIELFSNKVRSTFRSEVLNDIGGFGGLFELDVERYRRPVLVSSTDGVGTKSLISKTMGIHDTIGYDLIAHCVNDISVTGAEPLFFLDCITVESLDPEVVDQLVVGMTKACKEAGCALIGGEIAEHPGHLVAGAYDLSGTCVGVVERDALIDGSRISEGDVVIGMESSGLQTNGYSLARKVLLEDMAHELNDRLNELGTTLGEALLRPSIMYSPALQEAMADVEIRGMAHITGGGMPGNLSRVLPEGLRAVIELSSWEVPPIFRLIESLGQVEREEMHKTFNMGIGMVVVVSSDQANLALDLVRSKGHRAHEIGVIDRAPEEEASRVVLV